MALLEEQLLEEFARQIRAETAERLGEADAGAPLASEVALVDVMLGYLEEAGTIGDHEFCPHEDTTGRNRCRIVAYSLPDEGGRLELFTASYLPEDGSQTLPPEEIRRLTGQAARFFEYAAKGSFDRFSGNGQAADAARHIAQELDRIEEVRVYVLSNGMVRDRAVATIDIVERPVEFSVFDLERLFRASQEEVTRDRIEVDFANLLGRPLPCLEMKPPPSEYQTFLLMLPGNLIAHLYEEFGASLFEFNVRSFLQAKGKVNKGLRETLRTEPERFLAYNNGITATADEIEVVLLDGETVIKRVKGLQIVNGAQTTASIHRAKKIDKLPVDKVAVSMKLTKVAPEKLGEFVPLISQYANTQNVIQVSDLSANNPFHIKMGRLSDKVWCPGEESRWFYERTRGAYQVASLRYGSTPARRRDFEKECPKGQHFSKTDLARCLMTWWQRPQTVCRGVQKNFSIFMADLPDHFPEGWEPDEAFYRDVVSLVILFKAAISVVRRLKLPSYGTQAAAYAIAKMSADWHDRFSLETIWENQSLSEELVTVLGSWLPRIHDMIIEGAGRSNVGEWCKKDGCWDHVKALDLEMPSPMPPEIANEADEATVPQPSTGVRTGIDTSDSVGLCCGLDGGNWAKVVAWAVGSSKVTDFDKRVANTIAGYAMAGWRRRPSEKQARCGARVLRVAASERIIDLGR